MLFEHINNLLTKKSLKSDGKCTKLIMKKYCIKLVIYYCYLGYY